MTDNIHKTALIGPAVRLGQGVTVGAYAVIEGNVEVGDGVWIGPHVTIGSPAQFSNRKFELNGAPTGRIRIGARVVVRECATVHQPSGDWTIIDDDAYIMAYAHVSHDTHVGRGATLANAVQLGGFTWVGERANIGLGAVVHQFSTIGAYAMIGMGCIVSKDVPPFVKAFGSPVQMAGINTVGLSRAGFGMDTINELAAHWDQSRDPELRRLFDLYEQRRLITERPALRVRGVEGVV